MSTETTAPAETPGCDCMADPVSGQPAEASASMLPPPVTDFGPVRLELMGHRYREGHLSEVVIAGQPFLRLDLKGDVGVEFYRPDAVYCITPGLTPPPVPRAEIPARFAADAWADDRDDEEGAVLMSTTETETAHNHAFPCQPPRGSFQNPGPCECGKTYSQDTADRQLAEALEGLEIAYGVPPRVRDEWAVAWGSANLNDGTGYVEIRDDEEEAREYRDLYVPASSVVRRTVIALAWEAVPAKPDSAGAFPCCTGCGPGCACGGSPHETPEAAS